MQRGGFGELSVIVNGTCVYSGNRLLYPRAGTAVAAVRKHLGLS